MCVCVCATRILREEEVISLRMESSWTLEGLEEKEGRN